MSDLEAMGAPSILRLIRSAAALARIMPTLDLSCEENIARRRWYCSSDQAESAKSQFLKVISSCFADRLWTRRRRNIILQETCLQKLSKTQLFMRFNIAFCEELWKCNFQNMGLKAFFAVPPSFELRWPSIQFL